MLPGLLDIALGSLRLASLSVIALLLPILIQLFVLFFVGWLFKTLVGLVWPSIQSYLGLIGVPIHELSHAFGFLITLGGVKAIKLLFGGTHRDAFVVPSRSYFLANTVAPLAPLFGGTLVLWLTARHIIPGFEVPVLALPQLGLESAAQPSLVLQESLEYLVHFFQTIYSNLPHLEWKNWRTFMGLYVALSMGFSIAPSVPDLKILLKSLPLFLILVWGIFVLIYLWGNAEARFVTLQQSAEPLLLQFSAAMTYATVLSGLGVLIFLPLRIWQKLRQG